MRRPKGCDHSRTVRAMLPFAVVKMRMLWHWLPHSMSGPVVIVWMVSLKLRSLSVWAMAQFAGVKMRMLWPWLPHSCQAQSSIFGNCAQRLRSLSHRLDDAHICWGQDAHALAVAAKALNSRNTLNACWLDLTQQFI